MDKSMEPDVISRHVATDMDETKKKDLKENLAKYEQLFGVDEDSFVQPTTNRKELWSYYLYYNVSDSLTKYLIIHRESFRVITESVQDLTPKLSSNLP